MDLRVDVMVTIDYARRGTPKDAQILCLEVGGSRKFKWYRIHAEAGELNATILGVKENPDVRPQAILPQRSLWHATWSTK